VGGGSVHGRAPGGEESRGGRLPCSLCRIHGRRRGPMAERGATAKLGNSDLDLLEPDPLPSSPASTSSSPPAFSFFGRILGGASMAARLAAGLATAGAPLSLPSAAGLAMARSTNGRTRGGAEGRATTLHLGYPGLERDLAQVLQYPGAASPCTIAYCSMSRRTGWSTQCDQPKGAREVLLCMVFTTQY
jgi:hypothetical protein